MSKKAAKVDAASPSRPRPGWYRGIKLQPPAAPPTIPLERIKEAVEFAMKKRAEDLAASK